MPRGDKSKYTGKQERKADHIAEGYEKHGASVKEAESIAWATVNKEDVGGKNSGSGHGKRAGNPAEHQDSKMVGIASAGQSVPAIKQAGTRTRGAEHRPRS